MAKVKVIIGTNVPSRKEKTLNTPWGELTFDKDGLVKVEVEESLIEDFKVSLNDHRMFFVEVEESEGGEDGETEDGAGELKITEEGKKEIDKAKAEDKESKKVEKEEGKKDGVDPIIQLSLELAKEKVEALRAMAIEMKLPKEEWENKKKAELIKYLAPKI